MCAGAGCQLLPCSHQHCSSGHGATVGHTAQKDSPELWASPGHSLPPPMSNAHLGCRKQVIPEWSSLGISAAAGCGHRMAWQDPLLPCWWGQALILRARVGRNLASRQQLPFGWASAAELAAPTGCHLLGAQVAGLRAERCLRSEGLPAPIGHRWPFHFSASRAGVSWAAPWLLSLPTRVQRGCLCNTVQFKVKYIVATCQLPILSTVYGLIP